MTFASDQIHSAKYAFRNIEKRSAFSAFSSRLSLSRMAAPTCNFCHAREKYHQAPFQQFEIKRAWLLITVGGGSWQTLVTRLIRVNLEQWLAEPELTYAKHETCLLKHGLRELCSNPYFTPTPSSSSCVPTLAGLREAGTCGSRL